MINALFISKWPNETNGDSLTRLGLMMIWMQALFVFVFVLNSDCRGVVADESQGHVFCCSGHFWWHRSFLQPNILVIFTIRSYLQTVVHRLPLEVHTFTNLTARCACAVSLAGVIFALFCTDAVPKMSCLLQMYFSWPCNISYPWLIEEILEEMDH